MNKVVPIEGYIDEQVREFSLYTIYNRAIPNVIDGLKPSQRKILFAAVSTASNRLIKTASLSGRVIDQVNYHHGDASLNEAIAKMTQTFRNNIPLLDGEGGFGTRAVPIPSAARYTFTKLAKDFNRFFADNDITLPQPDPEDPEPLFYLPIIPWVLVNGVSGMATGFKVEILPRDYKELKKACINYLKYGDIKRLERTFPLSPCYPQFHGDILKDEETGKWVQYGKYEIKGKKLFITEIPTNFSREQYVSHLEKIKAAGDIIRYIERKSDNRYGFRFEVHLRSAKSWKEKDIIRKFKLSKVLTEIITTIDTDGNLREFNSPYELIQYFCDYRITQYKVRYDALIEKAKETVSKLQAKVIFIEACLANKIDFKVTKKKLEAQASKIVPEEYVGSCVGMPIYNLTEDSLQIIKDRILEENKKVDNWSNINYNEQYTNELKDIK